MNVYFEDEEQYVRMIKLNNITQLKDEIKKTNDSVILTRLFELSLKMVNPLSFKTLYFNCPMYAPANPLTVMTSTFINFKGDRHGEKYYAMMDNSIEIYNFLLEFDLINKVDYEWACDWAAFEDMRDLTFLE